MTGKDLKIVFMGTPEFASVIMEALIEGGYNIAMSLCQPDKPVGRKHILTAPPVKELSVKCGIECYQPATLKTDEAYETISKACPDLIVTAAYGKILPKNILDIPRFGCLNCHGSLLPARRGSAPVQRAVLEGDKVTGVTIMKMDEGMDTGDILSKVEVAIDPDIHTADLMDELARASAKILPGVIEDYIEGKIKPVPQDEALATSCPPIKPEEGYFTWDQDASSIHNRIRALSTWPGAYTLDPQGKKFKVYDSRVVEFEEADASLPGTVVKAHKGDLIVKCGSGYLKLLVIQSEGGKRLNASDCAHNFKCGTMVC
ncbi:MAG: methionyl-tRNA formyltransferase [Saccharofermentans sp.]|nr:methionyl-tRNA formyltransferase [Saccharofermentans sp.]